MCQAQTGKSTHDRAKHGPFRPSRSTLPSKLSYAHTVVPAPSQITFLKRARLSQVSKDIKPPRFGICCNIKKTCHPLADTCRPHSTPTNRLRDAVCRGVRDSIPFQPAARGKSSSICLAVRIVFLHLTKALKRHPHSIRDRSCGVLRSHEIAVKESPMECAAA